MSMTSILGSASSSSRLTGFIDRLEQGDGFIILAGWLASSEKTAAKLPIQVMFGNQQRIEIGRFFHRADLARKGIADGDCSFVLLVRTDEIFTAVPEVRVEDADGIQGILQSGYQPLQSFSPRASLVSNDSGIIDGFLIDPAIWLGRRQSALSINEDLVLPLVLQQSDISENFEICGDFGLPDHHMPPNAFTVTVAQIETSVREKRYTGPEIVQGRLSAGLYYVALLSGAVAAAKIDFTVVRRGKGYIEAFRNEMMVGWAAGSDISIPAQIDILWDGIRYITVKSSDYREDLVKKGIVEVGGGFRFQFVNSPGPLPSGKVSAVMNESGIGLGCSVDSILTLPPVRPANSGFIHVQAEAKNLPICIVVPIYNAADDLRRCLASLERRVTTAARLILIDDCSPDPEIGRILDLWEGRPNVQIIRNASNLGFSGSINVGIRIAGRSDVVLLNSDTVVTSRWLEKLRQAAYTGQNVATVTAISNNSGAFSVPETGNNIYGDWLDPERLNRLIQGCTGVIYPEAPTGNGFCMYIRRDCLDVVGLLDAEAFPRGYGEENDFCMRALRMGFRHIVDDRTFIY
ncbi:MAG: glycosyltransferase family 2 protein, partial [Janthinobacterium lividum]